MTNQRFEGLGITEAELRPGTFVMVPVGQVSATVNGGPCVIALARVIRPATGSESAVYVDHFGVWWLDVFMVPGGTPLPQMYRADDILGIPALGLTMDGVPAPESPKTEDRAAADDDEPFDPDQMIGPDDIIPATARP